MLRSDVFILSLLSLFFAFPVFAAETAISSEHAWHGRFMVLAWSILIPLGVIAARYFKVVPRQDWPASLDNTVWWNTHRATQYFAALLSLLALYLVLSTAPDIERQSDWHAIFGWSVLVLMLLQLLSAWLRGSKGGPTDPQPS